MLILFEFKERKQQKSEMCVCVCPCMEGMKWLLCLLLHVVVNNVVMSNSKYRTGSLIIFKKCTRAEQKSRVSRVVRDSGD